MITKKIKFLRSSKFSVYSKPNSRLIDRKLLDYLSTLPTDLEIGKTKQNEDLRSIAKHFKIKLILRKQYKYSGTAHVDSDKIILRTNFKSGEKITKEKIRGTFCHELAHIFQNRLKIRLYDEATFSGILREEQEAESSAIIIYKKLFPFHKFTRSNFTSYFKEDDIIFLEKYYKHIYPNDCFKWQK